MAEADLIAAGARALPLAPTFLALAARPDIISFAGGVPDPALFPYDEVRTGADRILRDPGRRRAALQYAPSVGYPPLRELIAALMAEAGAPTAPDDLVITNGAQQALDLVGRLLIDPGDAVAVTAPTFFAALDTFRPYRPRFLGVPFRGGRVDLDIAEGVLRQRPKFLYLIPDFQNPTGLSISVEQREALVQLCAEEGVPIVEDAAYDRLGFDGDMAPSLLAVARHSPWRRQAPIIHVNTFSKTIAPGLRVGWIAAPPVLREKIAALKLAADVHTSQLNQMIALEVAATGFEERVDRLRAAYASRCAAMIGALAAAMPDGVRWTRPAGGLFIWLEVPPTLDTAALLARCIAAGVAFVPGAMSFFDGQGANTCRLSFATVAEAEIRDGIGRLASVLSEAIATSKDAESSTTLRTAR